MVNKLTFGKGDIEKGFAEADLVLEHTFRMPIHHQGYLEPQSFLVKIEDDGTVNAWASTKGPFGTRGQFAKAAGIPASQIRVQAVHVGADFGGKSGAGELPICYFLAKQAKRPVKIVLTHTEELTAMNPGSLHCGQSENRREARWADDRALFASDPRHWRLRRHETRPR